MRNYFYEEVLTLRADTETQRRSEEITEGVLRAVNALELVSVVDEDR